MNAQADTARDAGATSLTWAERNQGWLVQEIRRLTHLIAGVVSDGTPAPVSHEPSRGFIPAMQRLSDTFALSTFERDLLLLTAGVELDGTLRRSVASATQYSARPNFALALDRLPNPHWDALAPTGRLRYWRLIKMELAVPLTEASLEIDERVLHYIAGVACDDTRLNGVARRYAAALTASETLSAWNVRLERALECAPANPSLVLLSGRSADQLATSLAALSSAGYETLLLRVPDLPANPADLAEIARSLDREAALTGVAILIMLDGRPESAPEQESHAISLLAAMRAPALLVGYSVHHLGSFPPERQIRRLELPVIDPLGPWLDGGSALSRALQRALQQFHVGAAAIEAAIATCDTSVEQDDATLEAAIWSALRNASRGGLDILAHRIESATTVDDIVLGQPQRDALCEIARQLRHRDRVYREWGFGRNNSRGLGICALFTGESGTGKTMAAEAIANEAGLDLYRIDLATVVSKYIGETEKNLSRLFDAAEISGAVLLFDEADALFGKRSEVRDGHDRYANIEVAYLLQRIEAYRGLAILTTNMRSALDRAFLRRIRFVVQFPFPDVRAREEIWRLQFPAQAPLADVDVKSLARLRLSGGHIRSVALNAAFKAAALGSAIDMSVLMAAARAEYAKLERAFEHDASEAHGR